MSKRARGREPVIKSREHLRKILAFKAKNKLTDVETAAHFGIGVNTIYNTINRYKQAEKKARKASAKKAVAFAKKPPTKAEVTQ
jgi:transposase